MATHHDIVVITLAADVLGIASGLLAVTIAIYLQWLSPKRFQNVPVLGFFLVGALLLTFHLEGYVAHGASAAAVRLVVYSLIFAFELTLVYDIASGRYSLLKTWALHEGEVEG